jgi:glutathione S-transferase
MLKILGRVSSINVRKVLWTCVELGLSFEQEDYGRGFRSTQTPEFLALNPNGLIPVLLDGDFVLWESNAICRYLASRERRVDLLPDAPQQGALVEQWMDWQATDLAREWRYAFMGLARNSPSHQNPDQIAASVKAWNQAMLIAEAQLERSGQFVLGEQFTLADVTLGLAVHRWAMTPMERPALPAVQAYYDRLNQRPGYREYGRNAFP